MFPSWCIPLLLLTWDVYKAWRAVSSGPEFRAGWPWDPRSPQPQDLLESVAGSSWHRHCPVLTLWVSFKTPPKLGWERNLGEAAWTRLLCRRKPQGYQAHSANFASSPWCCNRSLALLVSSWALFLWAELCGPKSICWSPNAQYFRM